MYTLVSYMYNLECTDPEMEALATYFDMDSESLLIQWQAFIQILSSSDNRSKRLSTSAVLKGCMTAMLYSLETTRYIEERFLSL
jgi:hypothetical protein